MRLIMILFKNHSLKFQKRHYVKFGTFSAWNKGACQSLSQ